jgi:hypothetical protein
MPYRKNEEPETQLPAPLGLSLMEVMAAVSDHNEATAHISTLEALVSIAENALDDLLVDPA